MSDRNSRREFLRFLATVPGAGLLLGASIGCSTTPGGSTDSQDVASGRDTGARDANSADAQRRDAHVGDVGGVDAADASGAQCQTTGSDIKGPFFRDGAPQRQVLAPDDEPGTRLLIDGTVYGPDCTTPLAGVLLDVWHADIEGEYATDDAEYHLRGQLLTDAEGRYAFESVRPGHYAEGGSLRPAHIHFMVSKPGFRPLTTQLYFSGDPYLAPNDPCPGCASDDPTLIIDLETVAHDDGEASKGTFDIVLAGA